MAIGTTAAILGAAAIGGGASILGGRAQARAAERAGETQAAAARGAAAEQRRQFDITQEQLAPFRDIGRESLFMLSDLLGIETPAMEDEGMRPRTGQFGVLTRPFTGEELAEDPGFQFRLRTGREALERGAAARGGLLAGRTGPALTEFGQELGSQEFGAAFNRFRTQQSDLFNRLFGVSEAGRGAALGSGQLAGQFARDVGQNIMAGGAATAAGQFGAGQAQAGMFGNLANVGTSLAQNLAFQNLVNQPQQQFSTQAPQFGQATAPTLGTRPLQQFQQFQPFAL